MTDPARRRGARPRDVVRETVTRALHSQIIRVGVNLNLEAVSVVDTIMLDSRRTNRLANGCMVGRFGGKDAHWFVFHPKLHVEFQHGDALPCDAAAGEPRLHASGS